MNQQVISHGAQIQDKIILRSRFCNFELNEEYAAFCVLCRDQVTNTTTVKTQHFINCLLDFYAWEIVFKSY